MAILLGALGPGAVTIIYDMCIEICYAVWRLCASGVGREWRLCGRGPESQEKPGVSITTCQSERFLSQAYPHLPQKIELVQTQMSFIFLAGEYVYKIKKPVNAGLLDYTPWRRHSSAVQEIEFE